VDDPHDPAAKSAPFLAASSWRLPRPVDAASPQLDRRDGRRGVYVPRRPEATPLYRAVADALETFLASCAARGRTLPGFVEGELRAFLDCGILAHGFLRVRCDACRCERLVPFSCKRRGFCPSCGGRRMADTAAHLVDRVIPHVPVRQWVLTVPFALRYRMAFDAELTGAVLREFVRAVRMSLRRRARRRGVRGRLEIGAVTFIQRFGDALNLNVHFHSLVLDGVYVTRPTSAPRFVALPPPSDHELRLTARRIACRIRTLLFRRGLTDDVDPVEADHLAEEHPLLALLGGAAVHGRAALGNRAGRRPVRLGDRIDAEDVNALPAMCCLVDGISLHAGVAVPARDRDRLERLCRYVARPPVSSERLSTLEDGRLLYRLKNRWRDGTTHLVLEPTELIQRLAVLIPPPRANLVRYHGILAPRARHRAAVVPAGPGAAVDPPEPRDDTGQPSPVDRTPDASRRYSWPELMRRVFAVDVLECPDCGATLRILAAIHPPQATRAILECLGLPTRPPPIAPARLPSRVADLDFDAC